MIRPDPLGILDVVAGVMLYFTVSPIPESIAAVHAAFLIIKGIGTMIPQVYFPLPVFIIGSGADVLSAAILFVGTPPILVGYKMWIAGFLFLKGIWGLLSFMG